MFLPLLQQQEVSAFLTTRDTKTMLGSPPIASRDLKGNFSKKCMEKKSLTFNIRVTFCEDIFYLQQRVEGPKTQIINHGIHELKRDELDY